MRGEEIVSLRNAKGYGARDLATKLDINPATLSRYENNHRPIPKVVEYAVRHVCQQPIGERLIGALREAMRE